MPPVPSGQGGQRAEGMCVAEAPGTVPFCPPWTSGWDEQRD